MNALENVPDRNTCRDMMAQWILELMELGQMSPTVFAVNLTVVYQRSCGQGDVYDHDRQRLFKSCVSKWKKGVQSPSLDNCQLLEDVRLGVEAELRGTDTPEGKRRLRAVQALATPGIVALREHLEALPRSMNSRSEPLNGEALRGVSGEDAAINATLRALKGLLQRLSDDPTLKAVARTELVQGAAANGHAANGSGVTITESQKLERLKRQIGELVLTLLLEQSQDAPRA